MVVTGLQTCLWSQVLHLHLLVGGWAVSDVCVYLGQAI